VTAPTHITVRVPLRIRRRPGRKTVVTPVVDGLPAQTTTRVDPALLKALARAFRYQRMLDDGRYASISEMAAGEKLDRGYLGRLLQLTLLAPEPKATPGGRYIVEAIVDGRQAEDVTLPRLMEHVSAEWNQQRRPAAPSDATTELAPSSEARIGSRTRRCRCRPRGPARLVTV
jgi:hypothetical protein